MITIEKPFIEERDGYAYLKAKITISDDTSAKWRSMEEKIPDRIWNFYDDYPPKSWQDGNTFLYFSVEKEYKQYLCDDRADAFVAALIYYAMVTGSDIISEAPISSPLKFKIENYLFPALLKERKGFSTIKLICQSKKEPFPSKKSAATGMSCGIDSLYSLFKFSSQNIEPPYKLTHLTYFNNGSIFHPNLSNKQNYTAESLYKEIDALALQKCNLAREVATNVNLPLVYVYSNMDKDYYRGSFGSTAVYRNISMVLALQGLFGIYYCSSAGWPDFFELNLLHGSEHYETLLCDVFSNETVEFKISDYETRFEKTNALADYDIAKKYLDVCYNFNSCGRCSKCKRTMLTLDILGKLDEFNNVFNVEFFKNNKVEMYTYLLSLGNSKENTDSAIFMRELLDAAVSRNTIPNESYARYKKEKFKKNLSTVKHFLKKIVKE